jgi:hypothetical protein
LLIDAVLNEIEKSKKKVARKIFEFHFKSFDDEIDKIYSGARSVKILLLH